MKTSRLVSLAVACSFAAAASWPSFAAEAGDPAAGKAKTSRNAYKGGERMLLRNLRRVLTAALREHASTLER